MLPSSRELYPSIEHRRRFFISVQIICQRTSACTFRMECKSFGPKLNSKDRTRAWCVCLNWKISVRACRIHFSKLGFIRKRPVSPVWAEKCPGGWGDSWLSDDPVAPPLAYLTNITCQLASFDYKCWADIFQMELYVEKEWVHFNEENFGKYMCVYCYQIKWQVIGWPATFFLVLIMVFYMFLTNNETYRAFILLLQSEK